MTATEESTGARKPARPSDLRELTEWLAAKRQESAVWFNEEAGKWQVFRHAEALTVFRTAGAFSNDYSPFMPKHEALETFQKGNFQAMDPPRHSFLRGVVSKAFTPRFVAGLAPRLTAVTSELLDAVAGRDEFDLVTELAHPLPVIVIAEVLGMPVEDRPLFRAWADAMLVDHGVDAIMTEAGLDAVAPTVREMNAYLLDRIAWHRASGGSGLIADLLAARGDDGRQLEDQEMVGFIALLLIAGHLTTTALLGNTMLCFHENPDVPQQVRDDPTLMGSMIEEVLRYRPPFTWVDRVVPQDTRLGGVDIPGGVMLDVWMASGNRDERVFPQPDKFDIRRDPNPHLAFGKGIHFCLGAPLARLEAQIALQAMFARYREIVIPDENAVECHNPRDMQGVKRLPVAVVR